MGPPVRIESWVDFLPTRPVQANWFDHMREVAKGNLSPEGFLRFSDGNEHELAHFIACEDRHLLDPLWGLRFDSFGEDPKDPQVFDAETEVMVIQSNLLIWEDIHRLPGCIRSPKAAVFHLTFGSHVPSVEGRKQPWYNEFEFKRSIRRYQEKWPNIDTVWAEFQRKVRLLERWLMTGEDPSERS